MCLVISTDLPAYAVEAGERNLRIRLVNFSVFLLLEMTFLVIKKSLNDLFLIQSIDLIAVNS